MSKKKSITDRPVLQGYHNQNYLGGSSDLVQGRSYKDRSTVCFTPTVNGLAPVRAYQSWNALIKPMNQKFTHIFINNEEVGKAYEQMVDILRSNPELSTWKYVLTLEHDNCPQPDALINLYEAIEKSKFDAVGALYWVKGEGGQPMCYGRPEVTPLNFAPWLPPPGSVAECRGLGMGMTLYKMEMLLDKKFPRPMFKTLQEWDRQKGISGFTQDLFFFQEASKLGYRFGCATTALCGHYDVAADRMW